jgi:cold shock CspA family protein
MEGVITCFNDEKGFGFIEGEDARRYFFHRDRIDKFFFEKDEEGFPILYSRFNLSEDDFEKNKQVFLLTFDPQEGEKGPIAANVKATGILMNSEPAEFLVQIINLEFQKTSISFYDNHPNYGAIARDYSSKVWMSYRKVGGFGKGRVDVREKILEINDRQKISPALIAKISANIIGKRITATRYIEAGENFPHDISDVVFHGSTPVHSVHQFILNYQKN